jgi:hypothetical protein
VGEVSEATVVAGECNGEEKRMAGEEGTEPRPMRNWTGTAVRLGVLGVSIALRRRVWVWMMVPRRGRVWGGGASSSLSGREGKVTSSRLKLGDPGSLGGRGSRSPYCGSMAGLISRWMTSGSMVSEL